MFKKCKKSAFVFFLCLSFWVQMVYALPSSVYVKGTTVNVRSGPGTNYKILGTVNLGYKLSPISESKDSSGNGKHWYQFSFDGKNAFIRSDFCKEMSTYTYDAAFEAELEREGFPESYKVGLRDLHANYPNWIFKLDRLNINFDTAVDGEMVGTKTLVTSGAISSFKSIEKGKYDFTTSTWPTFDGGAWVCASREAVRCYMDPRNFLYDPYIFQFELQTFNPNYHTIDGIKEMIKGTFLDAKVETEGIASANVSSSQIETMPGIISPNAMPTPDMLTPVSGINVMPMLRNNVYAFTTTIEQYGPAVGPGVGIIQKEDIPTSFPYTYLPKGTYTYAELIYDACRQVNANPYVIIAMILQEQGKNGTDSVSGSNKKFNSAYNYGNINAFAADGLTAIENGLKYALTEGAYGRPWNTKEKGIYGLCDFYANSYVSVGQDTFYLKKWNVQGDNMFKHQYMTNVTGAAAEGQLLGSSYDTKMLSITHEFKIPYYENMPIENCPIPTKDGSPNNRLKSLTVVNYMITPTFNPEVYNYSLVIDSNVDAVYVEAEAYDKKAAIGGTGIVLTPTTNTYAIIYCVAENGSIGQYNINIFRKGVGNVQSPISSEYQSPSAIPAEKIERLGPQVIVTPVQNYNDIDYTQFFNNINQGQVVIGIGPS